MIKSDFRCFKQPTYFLFANFAYCFDRNFWTLTYVLKASFMGSLKIFMKFVIVQSYSPPKKVKHWISNPGRSYMVTTENMMKLIFFFNFVFVQRSRWWLFNRMTVIMEKKQLVGILIFRFFICARIWAPKIWDLMIQRFNFGVCNSEQWSRFHKYFHQRAPWTKLCDHGRIFGHLRSASQSRPRKN